MTWCQMWSTGRTVPRIELLRAHEAGELQIVFLGGIRDYMLQTSISHRAIPANIAEN